MAGYGQPKGRDRLGFRFQSWGTDNNGAETRDGWNNSAFLNGAEVTQDHVCRPVITGSDGRAMPEVIHSAFLKGAEVTQDHVCRPVITGSDGRAMPGVIHCPDPREDGAITNYFPNKGGKNYSGSQYGGDKLKAQEFINNVQNAASDGGRTGFPGGVFGRQRFDYGGYEAGGCDGVSSEPTLITRGGWTRPSRAGWASPPEVPLGRATNGTGAAAAYLRESAKPSSAAMGGADRWSSAPPSAYQPKKRDSATTTIDSSEAARRYGGRVV